MDELLQKYANNELEIAKLETEMTTAIYQLKNTQTALKEANETIRQQIMASMQNNDIKKYENDYISITYVAPTTKKILDTAKLKESHLDIYEQCLKTSEVKASLRIKMKGTPKIDNRSVEELVL